MQIKDYNKKEFLLPNSTTSCAIFHAKTENNNTSYQLIIADCDESINIRGSLKTSEDCEEAIRNLINLEYAAKRLCEHIKRVCKERARQELLESEDSI